MRSIVFAVAALQAAALEQTDGSKFVQLFQYAPPKVQNPYGGTHLHYDGQSVDHVALPSECESAVADIDTDITTLTGACSGTSSGIDTLSSTVGQLQLDLSTIQTKSAANAASLASLSAQNDIQDADLERLIQDISDLEDLERELDVQVMIFDMLIKTLPNYDDFQTMLDSIDTKLTGMTTMAPWSGVYGDVIDDTTDVGDLTTDVTDVSSDIISAGTDVTTAVDAAIVEEGRISATTAAITIAEGEIEDAEMDFDGFKILEDFYTTNPTLI